MIFIAQTKVRPLFRCLGRRTTLFLAVGARYREIVGRKERDDCRNIIKSFSATAFHRERERTDPAAPRRAAPRFGRLTGRLADGRRLPRLEGGEKSRFARYLIGDPLIFFRARPESAAAARPAASAVRKRDTVASLFSARRPAAGRKAERVVVVRGKAKPVDQLK